MQGCRKTFPYESRLPTEPDFPTGIVFQQPANKPSVKTAPRAALFLLVLAGSAWAFQPFVVRDIRVEGIQRIEAGTVFSYLPVKVGDTMTDEKAAGAIRSLFATGFFREVRLEG